MSLRDRVKAMRKEDVFINEEYMKPYTDSKLISGVHNSSCIMGRPHREREVHLFEKMLADSVG
jgi:hypothetical protein